MPRTFYRSDRLGDEIHRLIAECLSRKVRDPRVYAVNVTRVDLTRDLSLARIYYVVNDPADREPAAEALKKAGGFLRGQLADRLKMRQIPELRFLFDDALVEGDAVRDLLKQLKKDDPSAFEDSDTNG